MTREIRVGHCFFAKHIKALVEAESIAPGASRLTQKDGATKYGSMNQTEGRRYRLTACHLENIPTLNQVPEECG